MCAPQFKSTSLASPKHYGLPLAFQNARETGCSVCINEWKTIKKKISGHMIKCLLTELGRAGRENIWLSVRTHGPRCARSVRPDLEPNIFPSGPPTQSISTYSFTKVLIRNLSNAVFFSLANQNSEKLLRTPTSYCLMNARAVAPGPLLCYNGKKL